MCGIAGFNFKDEKVLKLMTDAMLHRGPDDGGVLVDQHVSLGHRRLAILDLSEKGRQPMDYKDLTIVFNGEIYNYKEIREELMQKGHKFISDSDTEVILHAYCEYGRSCVSRFNGMWAFCIYDKRHNEFFLSRDRFGVKPLYYYFDGEQFIFASELKAIKKHHLDLKINETAVNFFFYQKYIGNELTIYENCFKLLPSNNLIFDLSNKTIQKECYFNLEQEIASARSIPHKERISNIKKLLEDAVEKRLIADVPVGSFLSGGLDSSLISAMIARKHKNFDTFSIGFKEASFDEVPYSKKVAEHIGTKHHVNYVESNEEDIRKVLDQMDEPFGDSSLIPTFLLSRMTREKVTVSLSGDAGDEVFGGYETYKAFMIARYIPKIAIKVLGLLSKLIPVSDKKMSLAFKIKKFIDDYDPNAQRRHLNWMSTFAENERRLLLGNLYKSDREIPLHINGAPGLLSIQLSDIYNYLPEDILKKVDIASMLNSLEARVPYLDYRLVPLVLSLPDKYKVRHFRVKVFLKQIATGLLPKEIIHRKKEGFTAPVSQWIRESSFIKEYLLNDHYYIHGFINRNYVKNLYNEHIEKRTDHARKLWLVFVFNYFMSNYSQKNAI